MSFAGVRQTEWGRITRRDLRRARRVLADRSSRRHALVFGSLSPKPHGRKFEPNRFSENSENPSEPALHVTDGLNMFRDLAGRLAPGRTVQAQIRAVARALYGHIIVGRSRTKAIAYGEAGPPTVLNFKYRYEAWKLKFVTSAETLAERELRALAKRLDALEARGDSGGSDEGDPGLDR